MYGGLFVGTLVVSPYHLTEERSNQAMGIGGFVGVLGGAFLGAALSAPSSGGTTASAGTGAGPRLPASSRPRGLAQLSPR